MKNSLLFFGLIILGLNSCNKTRHGGCFPTPIQQTASWKIQSRFGSIAGTESTLTADQLNNTITLFPNGNFICKNSITGNSVSGIRTMSNFTSIYGERQKIVFTPKLPMLDEEYFVLIDNTSGKMVLGDNVHDGYATTLILVP